MLQDLCDVAISIKFNHSEDGEGEDLRSSPERQENSSFKVKCFKCYRTKSGYCQECGGSQFIQSTHPMALLLNEVLMRKLNLKKINDSKLQHQQVCPIKEEEQEVEQKRPFCAYCNKECDANHYYCNKCPRFTVCSNCLVKSSLHEHKLIENISISNCINGNSSVEIKFCYNCSGKIQNCYTECKTCRKNKVDYKLCDECIDNKAYIHSTSHIMEVVTDFQSFKDNNIDTISQELQEEDREDNFQDSKEEVNQPDESKRLEKKNSSIANCLESNDIFFDNVLASVNRSKINAQASRVNLDIDGLFNSTNDVGTEVKSSAKLAEKQERLHLTETKRSKTHHTRRSQKENINIQLQQKKQEYVFKDYKCDICQAQPIINVRYHCQKCEDFDVCQQCFKNCQDSHPHQSFDRVDGRELRDKAVERMLHDKDLNIRVTCTDHTQFGNHLDLPLRKNQRTKTDNFNLVITIDEQLIE